MEAPLHFVLCVVAAFLSLPVLHSSRCDAAVNYVRPSNSPNTASCPGQPCLTLDEYVANSSTYFTSDTIFQFVNGSHRLSQNLTVSTVCNLSLIGSPSVIVVFDKLNVRVRFENSWNISLHSLQSVGNAFAATRIEFSNSANIELSQLSIVGCYYSFIDVYGDVLVSNIHAGAFPNERGSAFINMTHTNNSVGLNQTTNILLHNIIGNPSGFCTEPYLIVGVYLSLCINAPRDSFQLSNSTISGFQTGVEINNFCRTQSYSIKNVAFEKNQVPFLVSSTRSTRLPSCSFDLNILLEDVSFVLNDKGIYVYQAENITIVNCNFSRNSGSALTAIDSVLYFMGTSTFTGNRGFQGGAISLNALSVMSLPDPIHTTIVFENNTADDTGGALFFLNRVGQPLDTDLTCIFDTMIDRKVLYFSNNLAANGGDAIYGENLGSVCQMLASPSQTTSLREVLLNISHFDHSITNDSSMITSNSYAVRLCHKGLPDSSSKRISVYPGQSFTVLAAIISDPVTFGIVAQPIYSEVSFGASLGDTFHRVQETQLRNCTNLTFSIIKFLNQTNTFTNVSLTLSRGANDRNTASVINVLLFPCPIGFTLKKKCLCSDLLNGLVNVECSIAPVILRKGSTWIGLYEHSLAYSQSCQYCKDTPVNVTSHIAGIDQDVQCRDNHAGTLCGACLQNYSLALGSNRCLPSCTKSRLAFILVFAAAGLVLVFFVKTLDLTVSRGTLNGLIFYANIVTHCFSNSLLFYPTQTSGRISFLSLFISWVNLDLGIETCFSDGMDAYAKAWLQFVFPVYVLSIAVIIVIVSRYSSRASRLFGNNSVPLLATLILLSYSKLLRAVLTPLTYSRLIITGGSSALMWQNISYLSGEHVPLFVFAVAVLTLLWLPFTLALFSLQWIQRASHYKVLRWVCKLMPFVDAFTGPFKDKHRYWAGALLLARCAVLLFVMNMSSNSAAAVASVAFLVCGIVVYLASIGHIYRKAHLSVLELSYFLNLGILASGTLYVRSSGGSQAALVDVSIGIVFVQFVCTVLCHAYLLVGTPLRSFVAKLIGHVEDRYVNIQAGEDAQLPDTVSHSIVQIGTSGGDFKQQQLPDPTFIQQTSHYREPLLGYMDDN